MGDGLADTPLAGAGTGVDLCSGEIGGEGAETLGCAGQDGDGVLSAEVDGIRI